MAELHVETRIAGIEAGRDTVVDFRDGLVDCVVFDTQFVCVAEGEHRPESQCCRRVGLDECVADEDAVLVGNKNFSFVRITPPTR